MKFKFPETTLKYLDHHTNNIILRTELCIKSVFLCVFLCDCNTPTIYIVVSGLYGVAELNIYKQEKPKISRTDETKRKWGLEYLQTGKNENFQRKVKTLFFVVKQQ